MSEISIKIPDSLHQRVKELAAKDSLPVEEFLASAIAELLTEEYFEKRARIGDRQKFEAAMKKVRNVEPLEYDRP
ncbi:MAG: toxin-antitoxin system HicB family antitoxin [Bacteroidetes bacterium]|nr:toxin-antitoxin system HicB family antitoxin [Bacteroidota bacterium]MCW5895573.1 toxin-antitoxin system HicB family antitoxin [Bacteroidota bacterium]